MSQQLYPPAIFLGIDPGSHGGLAAITQDQLLDLQSLKDMTLTDIWEWLTDRPKGYELNDVYAIIEQVQGYVGTEHLGTQMFTFGYSAGSLEAFLVAAGITYSRFSPQAWQSYLSLKKTDAERGLKNGDTLWKNRLKLKAQALYPEYKITLDTADALLIAEFCKTYYGSSIRLKQKGKHASSNQTTNNELQMYMDSGGDNPLD